MKKLEDIMKIGDEYYDLDANPIKVIPVGTLYPQKLKLDKPISLGDIAEKYAPNDAEAYYLDAKIIGIKGCPGYGELIFRGATVHYFKFMR